ncbi:alanine aminotransferase 2-like, partial [Caerostris extrusa]
GVLKPFTEVIRADMNDIQAMGQKPLTFIREVLTMCTYPMLLKDPNLPSDIKVRANQILDECGGRSAAAYTYSEEGRCHLSSGSIEAMRSIVNVLNLPQNDIRIGILVPIPRDPTYTALLDELGIIQIDYYLEEDDNWSINPEELSNALETASKYCFPKAILVINPGSPTGSVLSPLNMEEIVRFAAEKKLVLLADEVRAAYQFNAFAQGCYFQSFKKTMMQLGSHTAIWRSCGLRCGCLEMVNLGEDVIAVYKKSICIKMCPGVLGQIAMDCMICPPLSTEPSYPNFVQYPSWIIKGIRCTRSIKMNGESEVSKLKIPKISEHEVPPVSESEVPEHEVPKVSEFKVPEHKYSKYLYP